MRASRFCSDCGEQIKAKRAQSLLPRSYCVDCAPAHRRARIALIAAILLCGALIFALGRITAPRERLYFIGTPVDLNATVSQASSNHNEVAATVTDGDGQTPREQKAASNIAEGICGAPTKSGRPCQRKVKGGGYCWQHRDKFTPKTAK
ncbi:MAG TPA: hypothetical protein VNN73_17130 [Blastocatellia bacterium]|nr:hypothetical protein [Blastocatellia bacterium]